MVTGFEGLTYELNKFEKEHLVPLLVRSWERRWLEERGTVYMKEIVLGLRNHYTRHTTDPKELKQVLKKISEPRIRKVIHHIRVNGLVPNLIATSKGYFKTENPEKLKKYIESCWERSNSFKEVALSMENQYKKLINQITTQTQTQS